jgi:RimJ/RimL family protein N-acetyltransferase
MWDLILMSTDKTPPVFLLRPARYEDVPLYCGFLAEPEVRIWLEDRCQRPLTVQQTQSFLMGESWARWAIESEGAFVGMTGLEYYDATRNVARFFIVIGARAAWGKGLGTAVTRAVLDKGFIELGLRKIASDYLAPNRASARIHERVGFTIDGCARQDRWRQGRWVDRVFLSILRDEYLCGAEGGHAG